MYDYMKALHARFCREPELQKVRAELDRAYREIKTRLDPQDQETLLQLADWENELREETSLTSFIAGFQLDMGMLRFGSFYDLLFLLVLKTVGLDFSDNPHTQPKSCDEGCQGGFLPQFILQIRQLEQGLLVLLA